MKTGKLNILQDLFRQWAGEEVSGHQLIAGSGSNRSYYRIKGVKHKAIGVIGEDTAENRAFFVFTDHFLKHSLPIPEILKKDETNGVYLLTDLGDTSLFQLVLDADVQNGVPDRIEQFYRQALDELIRFQVLAGKDLDFSVCYPRDAFDEQSMQWDLNYFKYYFLKTSGALFDEQKLEDDFQNLKRFLSGANSNFFMYRDFMTRNILVHQNKLYFIDYQGGRKGPIQYDLASILFQAKAGLPFDFRQKMLEYYMDRLEEYIPVERSSFTEFYYGFVWMRTLQVLGAYGFRGYFEKKPHFLQSVDYALKNVDWLLNHVTLPVDLPELIGCLKIISKQQEIEVQNKPHSDLTVEVNSFSFIYMGIPDDDTEHGGGFVFDCRALPNPGRYEEYRILTGLDQPVINFLSKEPEVAKFLQSVYEIADQAIEKYIQRGFDHLMISFGCTGGQHRSVYCAENFVRHIQSKYNIQVQLKHRMLKF
ncbi:MAG: phosphotransferase [Bacteroidales bacterium]|nr:phosphotransferase [Bacteroidales bacterium]